METCHGSPSISHTLPEQTELRLCDEFSRKKVQLWKKAYWTPEVPEEYNISEKLNASLGSPGHMWNDAGRLTLNSTHKGLSPNVSVLITVSAHAGSREDAK